MADVENRPPSAELPTPSSRKKGRRSWFTPGRSSMLAMEIKCERNNLAEPNEPEEEEADLLVLSHFTNPPRMDFGKMRPGKSKSKTLILRNPHDYEQEVVIEKFPFKKDFYVDFTRFMVGPEREVHLVISWTPMSEQNCREMVLFQINGVFRLQAYLFGSAVDPPKPRKRKVWKTPVQKVASQPIRGKSVANLRGMKEPTRATDRKSQHVLRSVQNVMTSSSEPSMETPKRKPRVSGSRGRASQVQRMPGRKSDEFISDHREVDQDLQVVRDSLKPVDVPPCKHVDGKNTETLVATISDLPSVGRETFAVVQPLATVERKPEPKVEEVRVPEITIDELSIMFGDEAVKSETPDLKENVRPLYTPRSMRRSLTYTKALQLTISPKQRKKLETSPESVDTSEESGIDCTSHVVESYESFPHSVQLSKSETSESNEFDDSLMVRHSHDDISASNLYESFADAESGNASAGITDCTSVTPNSFRESIGNLRHSDAPPASSQIPCPAEVLRCTAATPNSFLRESMGNLHHSGAPRLSQVPPSPAAVLSSSVPHNVMVKQLQMVKSCVQGRLSLGVPASPPRSPSKCSPKPLFTIGTNFPMHSPKGSCMPRLGVDLGHKLVNSGTITKKSKFATYKERGNTDTVIVKSPEDCGLVTRLFFPSPTTERREIFISPSQLNPATLEIPHTPDLLIRRMTVTKDKPTVLKPTGSNSCKRLFPGAVLEDESDTFEETIMPQSLHDESIFSSSSSNSENKSATESTVRQENSLAPVSRKSWQPLPKNALNTRQSDLVRKSDVVAPERKPNTRHGFTKVQTASVPVASPVRPRRSENAKPASKKSPGKRESSPLSKKGPVVKKIRKELAEETQSVPSPNGRKLTRTEQLRIAAAGKKKTPHDKPKTTRARGPVKGVAQGRLVLNRKSETVLPKHPMPFASKNMFYDERWIEKQERGFTRWLNFILTPLEDTEATKQKVDASKLCVDPIKYNDKLAPTKEVLSFRAYTARRKMNNLRRAACRLFQSDAIVTVIQKVEREIESGRLAVRKDRKLRADLGIKQRILDMVLSYNPLWLRIGLETIYGEILPIQKTTDVVGLSRFVLTRLLENPDIAKEYAHPVVPHLFREGYDGMLAKFTLKKFLMLVFFLDQAKQRRLIDHNPCLFCKDADFKTSRDLLIQFNKDYLSGEGDLTKHLSYLKYNVSHVQTALEEYDFAVTNLALDLRDGLRLTRVVEMLTQNWKLSKSLRAPAISRLQKIHNVEVAFKELTSHGVELEGLRGGRVVPRDVVDGHREKTLGVLWKLIFKFQVDLLIDEKQLREEIAFLQNNYKIQRDLAKVTEDLETRYLGLPRDQQAIEQEVYFRSERLNLLLKWCKAVCAYYGIPVENFTVSFSDGRALCYIVHHYHPGMLPSRNINHKTMLTHGLSDQDQDESGDESFDGDAPWAGTFSPSTGKPTVYSELLANEKENFKVLYDAVSELGGVPIMVKSTDMSNTIPDEKVVITYVSYLCSRLLDIREETRAARKIQAAWRKYWLHSKIKHNQVKLQAIVTIQKAWKLYYARKKAMLERRAVIRLQAVWRGYKIRKMIAEQKRRALLMKQTAAACCIQAHFRSYLAKKKLNQSVAASVVIQSVWRGYWARQQLLRQNTAATIIQEQYRARCAMLQRRERFLQMRNAALVIQLAVRRHWMQKYATRQRAAVVIQAFARKNRAQMNFWRMKIAAYKIQQWYRAVRAGREVRDEFLQTRHAAVTIQINVRSWLAKRFATKVHAALVIQTTYRMHRVRLAFLKKRQAAVMIQACYRRHVAVRDYHRMKWAVLVIQEKFNALRLQRVCRAAFVNKVNAVVMLQAVVRGYRARKAYERLLRTVIRLQAIVRGNIARRRYLKMKKAVGVIEKHYMAHQLGYQQWLVFNIKRGAAITIQTAWRGHVIRREYRNIRSSAVVIQSYFRMVKERRDFLRRRNACIIIQKSYRGFLSTKSCRSDFLRMKNTAVTIQASFRGWQCRRTLGIMRSAAVRIQKNIRCRQARVRYVSMRNVAIIIQRRYRAVVAAKQQKQSYEQILWSTIAIQASFRGWRCRLKFQKMRSAAIVIQKHVRCLQAKEMYEGVKNAAVTIQRRWRATLASRKQAQEYCQLRHDVIRIQAHVRSYLAQRVYQQQREACIKIQSAVRGRQQREKYRELKAAAVLLQWQHQAATKIQAYFRCYKAKKNYLILKMCAVSVQRHYRALLATRQQRYEFLIMKEAAIAVQACFKGFLVRKHMKQKHEAAVKIQTYYKCYKARVRYLASKKAAVTIQRHFRALLVTRHQRLEYLALRTAVVSIQASFRGYCVRRDLQQQHNAAKLIQTCFRSYKARSLYLERKNAALTIQRHYQALLATRKQRSDYLATKAAVVFIQALFRGYCTRRDLQQQHDAARTIQACFRRYRARARYLERKNAALTIQRHYRALLAMRYERYEYLVMTGAAMTIQAWYRGYKMRREIKEMCSAATRIQAFFRAHQARQRYKKRRWAAVTIQRTFRSLLLMKCEREEFVSKRASACLIQAAFRGHVLRSRFRKMKEAAVKIQAFVRMWRAKTVHKKTRAAVVVIQRRYRNCVVAKQCKDRYQEIRIAAVRIQVAVRGYLAKRASCRRAAARLIQASWKMHKCRSSYQKQQRAVVRIQATWRMSRARCAFIRMKSAVQVIQLHLRATLLARSVQKDFLVSVGAAITIQASVRVFISRRRYLRIRDLIMNLQARVRSQQKRREFIQLKSACVLLQRGRRAAVQAKNERQMYVSLKLAAVTIQALWRGRQARKQVREIRAAILIQAIFRMHRERERYRRCVNIVTRMQAAARGRIQRAEYRKVTSAVVVIQSWYRGCRTRKEIKEQMNLRAEHLTRVASVLCYNLHAIRIQRWFRRHQVLKLAKEKMHSVLLIQGWMRTRLERLHFQKKRAAALKIQAATRQWLRRREAAAIKIQTAIRRWQDRKNKEKRMKSANLIQAWYRGQKLRNTIKNIKIHQARQRITVANREATEDKKLCNRTTSALEYILSCRQLAAILEALMHLEVATRLSARCCERMVEDNAVPVLYTLVNGCNRSVAHMELIRYTFDILLNLAKYDKTRDGVCVEGAIDTIIHQMHVFLGKGDIFTKACTLLGVLAQDKHRREEITENKTFKDKILSIHAITTRKHKMKERQQFIKSKMATNNSLLHPTSCKQPKVMSPFWVLRKNKMKEIKEPLPAINFVMNVLHLAPKS